MGGSAGVYAFTFAFAYTQFYRIFAYITDIHMHVHSQIQMHRYFYGSWVPGASQTALMMTIVSFASYPSDTLGETVHV